jgi:DNA-binding NarL/FixJ family response regulator
MKRGRPSVFTEKQKEEILAMTGRGLEYQEIAKELRLRPSNVQYFIFKNAFERAKHSNRVDSHA